MSLILVAIFCLGLATFWFALLGGIGTAVVLAFRKTLMAPACVDWFVNLGGIGGFLMVLTIVVALLFSVVQQVVAWLAA